LTADFERVIYLVPVDRVSPDFVAYLRFTLKERSLNSEFLILLQNHNSRFATSASHWLQLIKIGVAGLTSSPAKSPAMFLAKQALKCRNVRRVALDRRIHRLLRTGAQISPASLRIVVRRRLLGTRG
jgi:hypothetical protein